MITIEPVSEADYKFLYTLMAERTPKVNISHRNMPTWEDHVGFCKDDPYPHRYIIWCGPIRVGTIYLTDHREIGLFIGREHQGGGLGHEALQLLLQKIPGKVYANINPLNVESIHFFKGEGFQLLQQTYCLN